MNWVEPVSQFEKAQTLRRSKQSQHRYGLELVVMFFFLSSSPRFLSLPSFFNLHELVVSLEIHHKIQNKTRSSCVIHHNRTILFFPLIWGISCWNQSKALARRDLFFTTTLCKASTFVLLLNLSSIEF